MKTREELIDAMRIAGSRKMDLMHFGDAGYEYNEELWKGIMGASFNALLRELPESETWLEGEGIVMIRASGDYLYKQLKVMERK